jgi:hypothetical protein
LIAFSLDAWWYGWQLARDIKEDLRRMREIMSRGVTPRPLQGTEVRAVPSSGSVFVPNPSDLRFTIGMRALWYEASIQELDGVQRALEGTLAMIRSYRSGGPWTLLAAR